MMDYVVFYEGKPGGDNGKLDVHGFVDAEWVGDMDQRRSTNIYIFKMFIGAISWISKKHVAVALSKIEVEYMAKNHGSNEVVWLQRLCSGIRFEWRAMKLICDS
jgi:hypothetical protein